jgi:hypothetical protein
MIRDHHEGYIGWEEYERNQKQLALNDYRRAGGLKSGRGGSALLSGMMICGRCGRRLAARAQTPVRFTATARSGSTAPLLFPSGELCLCQRAPMVFFCLREAKPHRMCRPALIADPARLAPHIFGNPIRQIVHPHEVYWIGFAPGFRALRVGSRRCLADTEQRSGVNSPYVALRGATCDGISSRLRRDMRRLRGWRTACIGRPSDPARRHDRQPQRAYIAGIPRERSRP